ncbi:MAG: hypothetical protein EA339_07715 [Rhodobacteraceae bacterium]|nr:MAG: hypothetical protein EA339_07715 [Paracoccaceae bacterium]
MIRSALKGFLLGLGISVAQVSAQTTIVPVRAGEHANFTRIVFQIPEDNTWILRDNTTSAEIIIDGPPLRFDLSQTFSRIPRTRLARVVAEDNVLRLQIACECDIRASNDLPNYLVVDISDSASPRDTDRQVQRRPAERPTQSSISDISGEANARRAGSELARALSEQSLPEEIRASEEFKRLLQFPPPQPIRQTEENEGAVESQLNTDPALVNDLGRVIARSVAGGKLQAAEDTSANRNLNVRKPDSDLFSNLDLREHFSSLSAGSNSNSESVEDPTREICSYFKAISLVDNAEPLSRQLDRPSFALIYDDLDRVQETEGMAVMNQFLAKGFGAEARSILNILDVSEGFKNIVRSVSALVDLERERSNFDFSNYLHCAPDVHLWNFLSSETRLEDDSLAAKELVNAFKLLPPNLRAHFGPAISGRLTSSLNRSFAEIVQVNIERIAEPADPRINLSRAKILASDYKSNDIQNESIERLISPEISDDALIFVLNQRIASSQAIEDSLIEHAENRLLPLRNHDAEGELAILLAKAHAQRSDFEKAFEYINNFAAKVDYGKLSDAQNFILGYLAVEEDDLKFIDNIFSERPWLYQGLDVQNRTMLAERLRELGFELQSELLEGIESSNQEIKLSPGSAREDLGDTHSYEMSEHGDPERRHSTQVFGELLRDGISDEAVLGEQEFDATRADLESNSENSTVGLVAETNTDRNIPNFPVDLPNDVSRPQNGLLSSSEQLIADSSDLRSRLRELLDSVDGRGVSTQ